MKTSSIAKISLTTVLALSLSALATMPFSSTAADDIKGGQRLLQLIAPATVATPAAAANAMACSSCKDKTVTYDASGKGSVKDIRTTTMHGCPSCTSEVKTTGFGRAKTDVVVHGCTMQLASAACCK